jgi:uridine monophosphate synthetase
MTFAEKLDAAIGRNNSLLCLGLDPNPEMFPGAEVEPNPRSIPALTSWLKTIVDRTKHLVCAYKCICRW